MNIISILVTILLVVSVDHIQVKAQKHSNLIIRNDGPSFVEGRITFYCVLDHFYPESLYYEFSDGVQNSTIEVEGSNVSSYTAIFPASKYKSGYYNMTVTISPKKHLKNQVIAFNYTIFQLTDSLIGEIITCQDDRCEIDEVAIAMNVTFFIQFHDPNEYLSVAEINYMWTVDYQRQRYWENNLTYMYIDPGKSNIISAVEAKLKNNAVVFGYFNKGLTVKVPVHDVNISGNPFIHHTDMLQLNISCNGSSPFEYCHGYVESNETASNFSCEPRIRSTTCSFSIERFFQNCGTYHIGIYISNDVQITRKVIEVIVYNVSKKPQLSVVIIPIVCSLLTLMIIAGGIAYCVQRRNQLVIEVANFDFQDDSESYVGRTFFEQLFDPFRCYGCNVINRQGSDCSDEESETAKPLLTVESGRSYST